MKIFLTGASGFIGKVILNSSDDEVVAWTRQEHDLREPLPVVQVDVIIHVAGSLPFETPENIVLDNVLTTYNLAEFARKQHNLKHFIYFSTALAYGPPTLYTSVKIGAEEILKNYNLPLTIIRLGTVYGPGQSQYSFIEKCIRGNITTVYDCDNMYIHVNEVSRVIKQLIHEEPKGTICLKGEVVNNAKLAQFLTTKSFNTIPGKPLVIPQNSIYSGTGPSTSSDSAIFSTFCTPRVPQC